jgi:DNA-binding transcriptional ArsR family regulator
VDSKDLMTSDKNVHDDLEPISEIDRAIHSPARLKIIALLAVVESADFTFILNQTGLTRGNLSSHLSKLEEVGYIHVKKEFVDRIPRTLISLSATGKRAIEAYRENMNLVINDLLTSGRR